MNAEEIIRFIGNAKKQTPVKVHLKGRLGNISFPKEVKSFTNDDTGVLFGDWEIIEPVLKAHQADIVDFVIENDSRNSAVPLVDKKRFNARIEPGAIIRDQVEIGSHAVIMMGAIINIGAVIGEATMIDMGAILGGRATVGKNCHIGAGAVLAGVIEPPSADPVVVEDDVLIGANAVVVEGVRIAQGAVVAAGAIVLEDVPPYTVVAGSPARVIKNVDAKTKSKTELMDELRKL
ncbi:MAG: 2,3,4,5-tetrahydropyridine-2,6-dicarboxylate N-acetyltransferase [Streptococcaceae bacterium]|nr:2,3,4,5-tetrahydropyridine-2,6-dicarboxylate N-acetyltransferase [Streptococcaceae bacterium]